VLLAQVNYFLLNQAKKKRGSHREYSVCIHDSFCCDFNKENSNRQINKKQNSYTFFLFMAKWRELLFAIEEENEIKSGWTFFFIYYYYYDDDDYDCLCICSD
jgi:hypothetical protein